MALRKINISVGTALEDYLARRTAPGDNISGQINRLARDHAALLDSAMPQFRLEEWLLLCDSLNRPDEVGGADMLVPRVRDAINIDAADTKWQVYGEQLMARLTTLSLPSRYAILDAVARFWAQEEGTNGERVARAVGLGRIMPSYDQ